MSPFSPDSHSDSFADIELREPRRFRVLLHNDDYTTMEFVIEILIGIFRKSPDEAVEIMLAVHENGIGACGVYTEEVAETKVAQVRSKARSAGYPLRCSMEEE
ncbi:MAG: ATP-dependent Clp protease adaptor ClpS [Desulfovibrio sp.]|jgi:ATP-dependent Clp protease adaptor protein ClpS|nr:ATP-dependent Clp protease adaptor ClpS [Desulfovibrio sp.]